MLRPNTSPRPRPLAVLALLVLGATSCDASDRRVGVGDGRDRPGRDGGLLDAAAADGARGGDGDGFDGAVLPDGRPLGNGGDGDGDGDGDDSDGGAGGEIDVASCAVSEDDVFELAVPFVEGGFAVTPGVTGFGLAYRADGDCRHVIETVPIAASGPFLMPSPVIDDCRTIRELSLAKTLGGFYLAWTDNSTNSIELHTMRLDADMKLGDSTQRDTLTDNALFERRPTLSRVSDATLLAWFTEDGDDRSIWTKTVGSSAPAQEVVAAAAGHQPIELAMAETSPDHAALAWVEEVANRGVWLQTVDRDGLAVGAPRRMTDYAAPGSTVDIATREYDGGAAIYSIGIDLVNFEVRFRRLHPDATFRDEEVKVISRPLQGKDAGLARVGGGYAVVYRAIPDGAIIREPEIRLAFVTREGNVARDSAGRVVSLPIVPAARDGSRIQVQLSVDGQLLIAFVDGNDLEQNTLRLVRRRLDCATR